jgi:hypothetical protein
MGLMWTFMGASRGYEIFSGLAEVTTGLLLLFRRTSTIGALIAAGVMLNTVVMNFCFDVPVKLYSMHPVLMALFLLIPDMPTIWNFFVLRRVSKLEDIWYQDSNGLGCGVAPSWSKCFLSDRSCLAISGGGYENYKWSRRQDFSVRLSAVFGMWTTLPRMVRKAARLIEAFTGAG